MADAIAPALTAAEWERRLVLVPFDGKHGPVDDAAVLYWHGFLQATSPGDTLHPRIAAATLALANDALPDGHPLKITRADVKAIRALLETEPYATGSRGGGQHFEYRLGGTYREQLLALAAKLDALLAPEGV